MVRKENHSLWQVRHLLTSLCGDFTWAPCETMTGPNDIELYTEDHVARHLLSLAKSSVPGDHESASQALPNGKTAPPATEQTMANAVADGDVTMADAADSKITNGQLSQDADQTLPSIENQSNADETPQKSSDTLLANGDRDTDINSKPNVGSASGNDKPEEHTPSAQSGKAATGNESGLQIPETGDAAASLSTEASEDKYVHPMFLPPANAKPDQNVGLPEQEAEHLRKILALYVQKQEEVCRGAQKLHSGLLHAERLRKDVLHWSKAEAHSGANRDMSDGEDWYDREEWGLTEDLKKGHDEEEEDTTTTGKKTRARR